MRRASLGALLALGLLLAGCGQAEQPAPTSGPAGVPPAPAGGSQPVAATGDAAKGRQVWLAQWVACHNIDPAKAGPDGPAVNGSSLDLLEARVLHATYPPGYKPKRDTKVMPPRPDLAASIPDLVAYLR